MKWKYFPCRWPVVTKVTRSIDVFFDLRLNKRLRTKSRRRWFETLLHPLWRHCNFHWNIYCGWTATCTYKTYKTVNSSSINVIQMNQPQYQRHRFGTLIAHWSKKEHGDDEKSCHPCVFWYMFHLDPHIITTFIITGSSNSCRNHCVNQSWHNQTPINAVCCDGN